MNFKILLFIFIISINLNAQSSIQVAPPPLSVMPPNDYNYRNLKVSYMSMSSGSLVSGTGYKFDYYDNAILRKKKNKESPPPSEFDCLNIYLNTFSIGSEVTLPRIDYSDPLNPIVTEEKVNFDISLLLIGARWWTGKSGIKYDIAGEIIDHSFGFAWGLGADYYRFSTSGLEDLGVNFSDKLWIFRAGIVLDMPLSKYLAIVPFYDYGKGKDYKSSIYGFDIVAAPFENARDWKISVGSAINTIKANKDKNTFWQISITKEWGKYYESTSVNPF